VEAEAKTITVSVDREESDVIVVVEDNGVGVPEEIRSEVFQPFYTTKPDEGGTGLGLAIAARVVTSLFHGALNLSEADGGGARFEIRLPRRARVIPADD
jgi:signal transduction histidine kinase